LVTVAVMAGSSKRLRRKWRMAAWTVDFDRPVLVAMVCRLTDSVSRLATDAQRSKYK
jgi:hypothetical protein